MLQFVFQLHIVLRHQTQHVVYEPGMEIAGQRTKCDHPLVIEEQGLASPLCHHAHRQHRGPGAGIGLAKELPFLI